MTASEKARGLLDAHEIATADSLEPGFQSSSNTNPLRARRMVEMYIARLEAVAAAARANADEFGVGCALQAALAALKEGE